MKIRSGFVSNSSSSSFIIENKFYKNIFDLAKHMINCRKYGKEDAKLIKIINNSDLNKDTPISFPTTNYNTYICKDKKGNYNIQTCNNTAWHNHLKGINYVLSSEFSDDDGEPYDNIIIYDRLDFWFPEYNIFGKMPQDYSFCKKHYCECILIKGTREIHCPECFSESKNEKTKI